MVTILLEKILSLLEGWAGSFASFIIDLMAKLNLIETETANLPDIKNNTDNISSNTDSMTATLNNIEIDTGVISSKVNSIDSNTTIIKNNINTISTNVGTASAFCEDTANNTLEIVDKITTIASDTTQLRTNSNSISSDVSEIKNTLGLYLYNTIVTEDSEGSICNFDTDLKDYIQEAKVDIPADAGGISGIIITKTASNIWDEITELGTINANSGLPTPSTTGIRVKNRIPVKSNTNYFCYFGYSTSTIWLMFYDDTDTLITGYTMAGISKSGEAFNVSNKAIKTPSNCAFIRFYFGSGYGTTYRNDVSINSDNKQIYEEYEKVDYNVSFNSSITDGAEVDLLSGIVKINTSPVTYDSIIPIAIRTYKGVNNIYSDIGDMSVTYRETLKHYLEKQNS